MWAHVKVITIGLGTITFNPNCVALICAAGEAKAQDGAAPAKLLHVLGSGVQELAVSETRFKGSQCTGEKAGRLPK